MTDDNERNERIRLTLPNGARYATVARIVVGGLAARHNLSYENLDDLQLAVETTLTGHASADGDVTLELSVREGTVVAEMGPIDAATSDEARSRNEDLGLDVVLGAVVDTVDFGMRGEAPWLRLEKHVQPLPRD